VRTELTRIGNSRGIRIPKPLIEQCGLGDTVELRVIPEGLVIAPRRRPRRNWKQAFAASPRREHEMLLDVGANTFDDEEWTW
jgi:antitoxin MazE